MAFGHPRDDSALCWTQALLTNVFPVAGVFWTTILAYMVYMNIYKQNPISVFSWECYSVCWGLPWVLSLLPLTTNSYGYGGNSESGWCFIDERKDSPPWSLTFWVLLSFYFWMWGALLLYCCLFVILTVELRRLSTATGALAKREHSSGAAEETDTGAMIMSSLKKFAWYPGNVILCWSLPCMVDIMASLGAHHYSGASFVNNLSDVTPTLLGLFNVIAFVCTNKDVNDKVVALFSSENKTRRTKSSVERQIERFNKSFEVDFEDDDDQL